MPSRTLLTLALLTAACVDQASTEASDSGAYLEHEERLDLEPVSGKADGVADAFDRNRVVDDDFFTAADALSPADIQVFLEDTPYNRRSFLADETIDGRPFSEILVEVSQEHGINPIMLLSRLQVEKSLVAQSTRPSGHAVDFAMGCGCPDNQPCNEAFRGIDRQIDCAATTLRTHYDGSVAGTGQWRKDVTRSSLDPLSITPQNHATASLYSYTPWVLEGQGGNWLVWNITRLYANALELQIPSGPPNGFVGSPCAEDLSDDDGSGLATCEFSAQPDDGFCFPFSADGEDLGICSLLCEGYCPDRGSVTTFCAELEPGAGFCLAKASSGNDDCSDIPGTTPQEVERFVGSSGVPGATARVCWPDLVPPEPEPEPMDASCTGSCGSSSPVIADGARCYCDDSCVQFGDCCGDYDAVCG